MVINVNIPPLKVPLEVRSKLGTESDKFFNDLLFFLYQIRERTGGSDDSIGQLKFTLYLVQAEPSTETAITGGTVIQYDTDTETVYRFVPDPYDYDTDAFYSTFDGSSVSNLIVSRK